MHAILLIGLVSACAAAPRFHHGPPPYHPQPQESRLSLFDSTSNEFFDTRQFWAEMANEMRELDTMLQQFYKTFPALTSTQRTVNGVYKITIPLSGFQEKEIVVKAREGVLMVQAVHKIEGGGENSYLDIKTLPANVNVRGTWQFEGGVLKISFPIKQGAVEGERAGENSEGGEEAPVTEHSREDLAPREEDDADADVGARGDHENSDIFTNEIPRSNVEATTYSVDLNDEIEFVPVRYQQRSN